MLKKPKAVARSVTRDKGTQRLLRMPQKRDRVLPGGAPVPVVPEAPPAQAPKSPEELYDELTATAPLLSNGNLPRSVAPGSMIAACSGNKFGYIAAGWFGLLSFIAYAATTTSDVPPVFIAALAGFGLVGVVVVYLACRRGMKAVRLVRHGMLTWAVITGVEKIVTTHRDSNGHTSESVSYDVSFVYRAGDLGLLFGEINVPSASAITDDKQELLIYDPEKPERVEFADLLPGGLRIDSMGHSSASRFFTIAGFLPFLIAPAIPLIIYFVAFRDMVQQ